jgi:hypothetical protein
MVRGSQIWPASLLYFSAAFSFRLNSLVQIPFYCFPSQLWVFPASLRGELW